MKKNTQLNKWLASLSSAGQILLFAGILIFVNILATQIYFRIDLTEKQIFTLSETTKNAVQNLDDTVVVRTYFSKNLPPQTASDIQYVNDMLYELSRASHGNINILPQKVETEDQKKEVREEGIPETTVKIREKDQVVAKNVFLAATISYHGKKKVIDAFRPEDVSHLEYKLLAAIKEVAQEGDFKKTIGIITNHTVLTNEEKQAFITGIEEREIYFAREVDVKNSQNVDAIVVFSPQETFTQEELFYLEQRILEGKPVLFFLDIIPDFLQDGVISGKQPIDTGLQDLLENTGIKLGDKVVADVLSTGSQVFDGRSFHIKQQFPAFPIVSRQFGNMNTENPATNSLSQIAFAWAFPLQEIEKENIATEVLLSSTDQAWLVEPDLQNIFPLNSTDFSPEEKGQYNFSIFSRGDIDTPLYSWNEEFSEEQPENILEKSEKPARVLVTSNGYFLRPQFSMMNRVGNEYHFFFNMLDYLVMDEDLVNIRAKENHVRPLTMTQLSNDPNDINSWGISESSKFWIRIINFGLIPLLILSFGIFIHFSRRR